MAHSAARPDDAAQLERDRESRKLRKARRKAREAAGEIKELNIVAMMDMMTILLVFLLKSYQATSISVNAGEIALPASTTQNNPAENIAVTISMNDVRVNDKVVLSLVNGTVPAAAKEGGKAEAFFVGPVYDALKKQVDVKKKIGEYSEDLQFKGQVNLIADKKISYRTLMEVLYTAGQAELGEYKFLVLKNE
jgi:biopolymer transport protein ExbD